MLSFQATQILASVILAAPVLAFALALVCFRRRLPLTLGQSFWYGVNRVLTRVLWGMPASPALPVPSGQGAIIVCNHRSSVDPTFVQASTPRPVHWMVAQEYCDHWAFGWFMRLCETIPTRRAGNDVAATKTAVRYAQGGALVGIFLEGRINTTEQLLLPGRLGAALIALRARVPIVPCWLEGVPRTHSPLGPLLMMSRVRFFVGSPIDTRPLQGREDDRQVLEALTRRALAEMARLAGRPNYEPQVARRAAPSGPLAADATPPAPRPL